MWTRLRYNNDNQPCFQSSCKKYFLYFRATSQIWVIDDLIEQTGPSYSCSSSSDLHSVWISSPSWEKSKFITAKLVSDSSTQAFRGECVLISGCSRLAPGSSASSKEDGLYKRLPKYDDINQCAHYLKDNTNNGGYRRHLFYSSYRWQVSPVCNEDQGMFIQTLSQDLEGEWQYIPPDVEEKNASIKLRYFRDNDSNLKDVKAGDDNDDLDPLLNVELLRWAQSNHECILFSNTSHTVNFLSLNPLKLRRSMHPLLLKHLEQNNITVGEDLDSVNRRHWEILSALTGVRRTAGEAAKVRLIRHILNSSIQVIFK